MLLCLNCNAKLATAGKPGNSLASPEGQAEKAAEEEQAAKDAAAQQSQSSELATPAVTGSSARQLAGAGSGGEDP